MINNLQTRKAIWHEMGHVCMSILAEAEINKIEINFDGKNFWGGFVTCNHLVGGDDLYKEENLSHFCNRIFNYFAGNIFETYFLNKSLDLDYNPKDKFEEYRGDLNSDCSKYNSLLVLYKLNNSVYLKKEFDECFLPLNDVFNNENLLNEIDEISVKIAENILFTNSECIWPVSQTLMDELIKNLRSILFEEKFQSVFINLRNKLINQIIQKHRTK